MLRAGTGAKPQRGQSVTVQCTGCAPPAAPHYLVGAHTVATPRSFGKNRDLAVPFWSTKDAGQKPFTFTIGQGAVIKARSAPSCTHAQPC